MSQGKKFLTSNLINHLAQQEDLSQLICELTVLPAVSVEDKERIIDDCVRRIKQKGLKTRQNRIIKEIKLAESLKDEERLNYLKQEFCRLTKIKSENVTKNKEYDT